MLLEVVCENMQGQKCTIGSEARDEPGDMPLRIRISRKPGDETTSMHKSLGLMYSEVIHAVSSCSSENIEMSKSVCSVSVVILTVVFCCCLLLEHTIAHCDHNMH